MHISKCSTVKDHCRAFGLSDPKDTDYQSSCSHDHNDICEQCELFGEVYDEVKGAVDGLDQLESKELKEELLFTLDKAKQDILLWKAHLLRSDNQDEARLDIIDSLDETSVLVVQDWAMKFLPRKYRESQSDWFSKRGISWHLSVAIRKNTEGELQMLTFVNIFQSCNQDNCSVLAVMSDVLQKLKVVMPALDSIHFWQDNAGCYHCGATIMGAVQCGELCGVTVKRMDFADPKGGKGACDRKAGCIKSHMKIYLNAGNNIESSSDMRKAIQSSCGVPAVNFSKH